MKKNGKKWETKLQLHRETLHSLTQVEDSALEKAAGGAYTYGPGSCWAGLCVLI